MKRSRFTEEQIIGILKEQENSLPTKDVCPKAGISSATFYKWMAKYGGLDVSDARKLRAFRQITTSSKNCWLNRCLITPCSRILLQKVATPAAKRQAVTHLCEEHDVSQRRACDVLDVDRSTVRYRSVRSDDVDLRKAIREVAQECRRIGVMLERQGIHLSRKKLRRLYHEEKFQVLKRGGRKRALGTRRPMVLPSRINERLSLDCISDAFTDGRRFRVLAVIDDYSRECLALVADTSLSGGHVARELDAIIGRRWAKPKTIVSDNGTELTSMAILN